MPHFDTTANIVNAAGKELGLWQTSVSNPFASTDDNVKQVCALLNRVGKMLVRSQDWSHLTHQYTFNTVAATDSYVLPTTAFTRIVDGTIWNRTTVRPLLAVGSREWQEVNARNISGTVQFFRINQNQMLLYPTPTAVEAIYYEFINRLWVMPTGQTAPTLVESTTGTDVLWFDEPLLVAGAKLEFARAHNRDTSALQAEYDECYSSAAGGDSAAPILSIASGCAAPLLGDHSVPDTGYGG